MKSGSAIITFLKIALVLFMTLVIYGSLYIAPEAQNFLSTSRVIFYHVPMAWVAVLAFLVSAIFSVLYLMNKNLDHDTTAVSSAQLGFVFSIAATVTGSIWAKAEWGSFWNWDPRETSILVLLLIYAAYFSLRTAIENTEQRAQLSAVYSIIAFVTVPFLIFVVPRVVETLHPENPVFETEPSRRMSSSIRLVFFSSIIAFTGLYFWILKLRIDLERIHRKILSQGEKL
ncbi:MAG: cytochrome c biogenesis protein CcsA [Calditrichia bacterium]